MSYDIVELLQIMIYQVTVCNSADKYFIKFMTNQTFYSFNMSFTIVHFHLYVD